MQYFSLLYSFSISCYNIDMKKLLLELAHEAINHKLTGAPLVDKEQIITQYPKLNDQRATFVTLNLDGRLRGCIGSLIAHRTLYDDIIHNAQSAAFGDPRFAPLSLEEFQYVDIEISLLTPAELLPYDDITDLRSKIIANKHFDTVWFDVIFIWFTSLIIYLMLIFNLFRKLINLPGRLM